MYDREAEQAEAIERGWACLDGSPHYYELVTVGDRVVDESCAHCAALRSEER